MTRVLVLGAGGMLGHKVIQRFADRFDVMGAARTKNAALVEVGRLTRADILDGLDAEQFATVERILEKSKPDVVVNCVGIIKQRSSAKDAIQSIRVNALFPHELGVWCGQSNIRLIHLSTDCVFSGERGRYLESDRPDPADLYGRSKLLGEVSGHGTLTIRTSMIGREIHSLHSLVEWFCHQPAGETVKGFTNAIFSGLTTIALADEIGRIIADFPDLSGLLQVSAEPVNKFDLLRLIRDAFGIEREIIPDGAFHCDRSLVSDRYRTLTGYTPRSWATMIAEMASDPTPYARLQALASGR